ncbi:MAG: YitT family protein [candidate division WOR-3 bacterium]|nr:MAG: YitT family protein [candidate division WOR-3 bacterium]
MKYVKLLYIILGGIIFAFGYAAFLIPHKIVPGGVSGIAMILRFLYNTPVGIVAILLNIPLFIIALRILGISFGVKSLAAIIYTNLLIDFFVYSVGIKSPTDNVVLATLYGGILLGLGLGLIFRGDASTGGTDIVGQIFSRYTNLSIGMWIMIVDFAVITMAGITTRSIELALLGYLALFLSSKVIDLILEGIDYARAAFIISTKSEKITDQIYEKMQRGVTILDGHSPYSREKRPVIMCVITKKETPFFKSLVKNVDRDAFVILTDVFEVLGKGFRSRV